MLFKKALLVLALFAVTMGQENTTEETMAPTNDTTPTLTYKMMNNEDLSIFFSYVEKAQLEGILAVEEFNFTMFAPTNDAFTDDVMTFLDSISGDEYRIHLLKTMLLHVTNFDVYQSTDFVNVTQVPMQNGDYITITAEDDGVVSLMDTTNGTAFVQEADIDAVNGMLHIIDAVMTPSWTTKTLMDEIEMFPDFSTFVKLVSSSSDVAQTLAAKLADPTAKLTVFPPNDDAFKAVDNKTLESLMANPADLEKVLMAHVVEDSILTSMDFASNSSFTAVSGDTLDLATYNWTFLVNEDIEVSIVDWVASNGIFHGIKSIIVPEGVDIEFNLDCSDSVSVSKNAGAGCTSSNGATIITSSEVEAGASVGGDIGGNIEISGATEAFLRMSFLSTVAAIVGLIMV